MKSILIPLDGSKGAEASLPIITQLCSPGDKVVLLMVTKPTRPTKSGTVPGQSVHGGFVGLSGGVSGLVTPEVPVYVETVDQADDRRNNEAKDYLKHLASNFDAAGLDISVEVTTDDHPASAIVKHAKSMQPTFIAMTHRAHPSIAEVLLGDVAVHVMQAAVSPVLLVPSRV